MVCERDSNRSTVLNLSAAVHTRGMKSPVRNLVYLIFRTLRQMRRRFRFSMLEGQFSNAVGERHIAVCSI